MVQALTRNGSTRLTHLPQSKFLFSKTRMELGNTSNIKWFDGIGEYKGEYKIDWGPGYRIYLAQDGLNLIILFGGGTKKSQKADIKKAVELLEEYKERKKKQAKREGGIIMTLTRDYKETIHKRAQRDPDFAKALLDEALTLFINGEPDVARIVLRDLVNSTIGFETLAQTARKPSKSIQRMLSAKGNPTMDNLTLIFNVLRKNLNVNVEVHTVPCVKVA